MSAAFSAIMIVGALVLPEVIVGITDVSTTRRPATPRTLTRAAAFARAAHPALQLVLRVDHPASRIWLDLPPSRPLDGPLTAPQVAALRGALDALHRVGVVHGSVDRAHVLVDEAGGATLRFAADVDPTATVDRDRIALARLADL